MPDAKTLFLVAHIFGVALGAGGAFMSDAMFMSAVRDSRFSKTEIRFLKLASVLIWSGLTLLVLSGIGIFSTDPERYMASSKFLAKMTIVGVIVLNGFVFHFWHLPLIHRHTGVHFPTSDEFMHKRVWILVSGAVSALSWSSALVLGSLSSVPLSYGAIMGLYGGCITVAIGGALLLRDKLLPRGKRNT